MSLSYPPTPVDIETATRKEQYKRERRSILLKQNEDQNNEFSYIKSLYTTNNNNDYNIVNLGQRYVEKYNTTVTSWRITGDVNLFNINLSIKDLINIVTQGKPENVRIQIVLKTPDGRQPDTKLLTKSKITDMLTEWVNYLIDYKDLHISDIIFQVTAIEIPTGSGRRRNAIITLDDKRCITQIKNLDTICLARSIVVALSYHKDV